MLMVIALLVALKKKYIGKVLSIASD